MNDAIIFITFIGIQATFHAFGKGHAHVWIQRLAENHFLVWLFHPAVVHGAQDWIIHFVVYSGKVLASH